MNLSKNAIIIGSGVAGMNVVYGLMQADDIIKIICITKEKQYAYSTCGIPYVLEGIVEKFEDIILRKPEFFEKKDVKLLTKLLLGRLSNYLIDGISRREEAVIIKLFRTRIISLIKQRFEL